jgi:hypothetical protein
MRLKLTTVVCVIALAAPIRAAEPTGEQIYKEMCVRCHGAKGEGTKKYAHPLTGDWSIARLTSVIDRTMPEDDPDQLDAAGSKRVAEFMYDAFYSPVAQARLNPPRIELARLTVKQYRYAIADLIGSFRQPAKIDEKRGLHAEYFNSRNFQNRAKLIDRVDHEVNFDFGKVGPDAQDGKTKFDPHQFSIRWEGSVIAPETGNYEFVVKTDHATRLWVNDAKKPLIDKWVKSGSDTEFRESIFLLAGRPYTLRLEFSKAKQGVDDSKKNPNPPAKPASISLWWKRPNRTDEVIATRFLTPARSPEVAVIDTPFPPDDRSFGWERGTTISREWDAATSVGAIEAAAYISARLPELANVPEGGGADRTPKLRDFARKFAERAFRRPLTDEDQRLFIDRQFAAAPDPELALKRIILLVLKSPRFLFPEVSGASEPFAVASRLALVLWDSAPDKELLDAAAVGKLGTRAEVAKQAERMLNDPRARAKLREFLLTWLKVDHPKDLAKDAKRFPGFDSALAADLRSSLELFLDDVFWSDASDFRQLLLSDELYLNGRLARFYGVLKEKKPEPPPFGWLSPTPRPEPEMPFTKMKFESHQRAGVLTHPYMLASLAYTSESSPIHRGVFVGRGLLGIPIKPPMDAFTPLAPDLHPNLTTRERVSLQTKPDSCATCHSVMNPLGFALENFDAVGRYREQEHGKRVDASGHYETRAGTAEKFTGARELAKFLADSPEVHAAFVTQLFHHLVKQAVRAYGIHRPEELRKSFSANDFNMRKLVVEIAVTAAMEKRH